MKVRLGDICEILNGYAFKSSNYVKDGVRIIRISNVQKGFIEDSFPVFYPKDDKYAQNYALIENDLLISLTGNVGRVALLSCDLLPAALNQRVACIRIKNRHIVLTKYLFHLLNSDRFEQSCITSAQGIAQKNMSTNWLQQYEIAIVPLEIQSKIINVLDTLDNLISHRKEQLLKLAQIVKSRFMEMFGEQYEEITIGSSFITTSGGTPAKSNKEYYENGSIPWLTSGEVNSGVITKPSNFITELGLKHSSAKLIPANSVVIAMYGATAGQVGLVKYETSTNQAVCSIMPQDRFISEYLYYAVQQKKQWMKEQCTGGAQPNISQTIIKKMRIRNAPLPLQQQFAAFVEKVDKSKLAVKQSLEKLETLKKSLMQQYFG